MAINAQQLSAMRQPDPREALLGEHFVPLFNQSKWLTRDQVRQAFGERVQRFWDYRRRFDPHERLLNDYFRQLLRP